MAKITKNSSENMEITFFSEDCVFDYPNTSMIIDWMTNTIVQESAEAGDINIIFCSNQYLLEMNKKYLGHDYFTDIITFDYTETIENKRVVSGDLFISLDMVRSNSKDFDVSFIDELDRVIIHGVLHLLGYDDHSDEDQLMMSSKEDFYLKKRDLECN